MQTWLAENRNRMAWLGLFDQGDAANGPLAEKVEWLTAHLSTLIELDETVPDPQWEQLNSIYQEVAAWLNTKSADRWKDIDALTSTARGLNFAWAAAPVEADKREVEQMVASGTAAARQINAKMRALDARARDWPAALTKLSVAIGRHIQSVASIDAALEQFDDTIERYEKLKNRQQHIKDVARLRKAFDDKTQSMERTRAKLLGPNAAITLDVIESLAKAYDNAAQALETFDEKDIVDVGGNIQSAEESLPLTSRAGSNGRTSLPKVTRVAAATLPSCEMLIPAVKESTKTPEWKQAAVDFTLGNLALGRPDHIHICGGGNTLVYRNRLIRGYMTVHLDSRPESQLQFNKILYRDQNKKVLVAVQGGVLKEVI